MAEQNKDANTGTGPLNEYYGNKDGKSIKNTLDAHRKKDDTQLDNHMSKDGASGKADQIENANKHTDEQGHDDLDKFDMNSLRGKVE